MGGAIGKALQKRFEAIKTSSERYSGAMRSIEPGISRFRVWVLLTIAE